MRAIFVDANPSLAAVTEKLHRRDDPPVTINRDPDIRPDALPDLLKGYAIAIDDHTQFPTAIIKRCPDLKHVVFLGTGARSYMDPEALAELGIAVHLIKGYGDTAVAECAIGLLFAAARGFAGMDRAMREGRWLRSEGTQLGGKTLGLIGFGGIAAEVARMALGLGMRVLAWNRTPKAHAGVEFPTIERLLAESDAISLHLLLNDETRGFLDKTRIARMKPGAILVNTARGALVDEAALIEALNSGHIRHAGLDVFHSEPLKADHPLARMENVTLSAHAAFRTLEASMTLLRRAIDIVKRVQS